MYDELFCPRCPDGTRLEDDGDVLYCRGCGETIPLSEVAEVA